jgi:ABC-type branched-subunit amino acid transport system substrate-binding protein
MYSAPRSADVKCAVDASQSQLKKDHPRLDIQTISYSDDPASLTSAAKIITAESYDVAIGPMLSHEALIIGSSLSASSTPLFLPIASNPELTKKFANTIRMISNSNHYAQLAAANALRSSKNKSIFVMTNQSLPYSRDYTQEFIKQLRLRKFAGEIHQYKYLLGQADFKMAVKTVAAVKADLIYAPIYSEDLSALYFSLSDAKMSVKIFTHAGLFDAKSTILAHYDPNIVVQFNGIWDQQTHSPADQRFLATIASKCDATELKPWTMAVWDAVNLALATHEMYPKAQGQSFVDAVKTMTFTGILGKWTLDTHKEPLRSLPVYSLQPKGSRLDAVIPASEIRGTNGGE